MFFRFRDIGRIIIDDSVGEIIGWLLLFVFSLVLVLIVIVIVFFWWGCIRAVVFVLVFRFFVMFFIEGFFYLGSVLIVLFSF